MPADGGCDLLVHVVPNASKTAPAGLHDGALRLRLAAPPIDGRANNALVEWLADELGLPRRGVRLLSGETSRRKRLRLECDPTRLVAWLQRASGP